jgi:hypothetical protein
MISFGSQRRDGLSALGLLLVVLAMVSRIAMPNVAMGVVDDQATAFDAIAILCQTGDQPTPAQHAPLHQDNGLACLLCQSAAHADIVVPMPVYVPYPAPTPVIRLAAQQRARAPPARVLASRYSTGPPARA